MENFTHWKVKKDDDGIVWLGFDRAGESVNSINDEVLEELNGIIQEIQQSQAKGLIIHSLKETGFIAGADVKQFTKFDDPAQAIDFIRKGQAVFDKLESLAIPTVAMIDGFCMGGGTELALACDYRIASNDDKTRIGLPEVLLGIHPGWGGTVRLPKLIGGFDALSKVILPGAGLRANKAKKLGMIDEAVPLRQLKRAAVYYIQNTPEKHKPTWLQRLSNQTLVRKILANLMRSNLSKRIRKEHYPAPYAVVDNWERDGGMGARAQIVEADSIETLITRNSTAENLIRAYFLREKLKSFSKMSDFKANHVHVIGAGVMGGDIAAWCALKGCNVSLQDQAHDKIAPAIKRAHALFKKRLKKPRLIQAAMDRLSPDVNGYGIKKADVVIEAVFENLEVKQEIFKAAETQAPKHAILATNTSSIPLDEINTAMQSPERLVGIHFFNPVAKMMLIEVVKGEKSDADIFDAACAFVGQIGRLPLPVRSSPGFLVNRVLMPYLMECVSLLEEGYSGEEIDEAAKAFGMMMGPVELADTVGLDVCLAVAKNLSSHYGGKVPDRLQQMVDDGELGRKTGKGFYTYKKGKPVKKSVKSDPKGKDIANRLILRMVNESAACLREKVVENDELLDAGMVFGTGFAPFRGGPMNYAHNFGEGQLNELFHQLESRYGERFKADASLK